MESIPDLPTKNKQSTNEKENHIPKPPEELKSERDDKQKYMNVYQYIKFLEGLGK
jgi:hypothetical protein